MNGRCGALKSAGSARVSVLLAHAISAPSARIASPSGACCRSCVDIVAPTTCKAILFRRPAQAAHRLLAPRARSLPERRARRRAWSARSSRRCGVEKPTSCSISSASMPSFGIACTNSAFVTLPSPRVSHALRGRCRRAQGVREGAVPQLENARAAARAASSSRLPRSSHTPRSGRGSAGRHRRIREGLFEPWGAAVAVKPSYPRGVRRCHAGRGRPRSRRTRASRPRRSRPPPPLPTKVGHKDSLKRFLADEGGLGRRAHAGAGSAAATVSPVVTPIIEVRPPPAYSETADDLAAAAADETLRRRRRCRSRCAASSSG